MYSLPSIILPGPREFQSWEGPRQLPEDLFHLWNAVTQGQSGVHAPQTHTAFPPLHMLMLVAWELSNPQLSGVTVSGGIWTGIQVSCCRPSLFAQILLEFNFWAPGKQPAPVVSGKKVGENSEKPGRRPERANPG